MDEVATHKRRVLVPLRKVLYSAGGISTQPSPLPYPSPSHHLRPKAFCFCRRLPCLSLVSSRERPFQTTTADSLEPQVQVLREFLSEYEHEASGGGHSTGGPLGGSRGGGGMGLGDSGGDGSDADDRGMDEDSVSGGGMGGGGGGTSGESPSRGRDWVRHELCCMLVSNLFSSKTLRERLSKKPVAGILVGLLCGPPIRWNNSVMNSAGSRSVSACVGDYFPDSFIASP